MADSSANLNTDDMLVFTGCCCANTVLYLDFPAFVGCSFVTDCICCHEEFCLKQGAAPMPIVAGAVDGFLFKLGLPCCALGFRTPELKIKSKGQCCCFVGNCALPPDEDTPLMCAVYGLACFPKQGCCMKKKDLLEGAPAPASTA